MPFKNYISIAFLLLIMLYSIYYLREKNVDDVQWLEMEKTIEVDLNSKEAIAKFKFTSPGRLKFENLYADCLCTTPKLDKREYSITEKGELEVVVDVSKITGLFVQKVYIEYLLNGKNGKKELTIKVKVPEILVAEKNKISWKIGEEIVSKSIRIKIPDQFHAKISNIIFGNDNFKPILKIIEEGREYELIVTPLSTKEKSKDVLHLITDFRNIESNILKEKIFNVSIE